MEECIAVHTLREFMIRIMRLESLVCGEHGGVIGEAIRACDLRLDNHKAILDDFYARIRTQAWYHDLSEQESEEEMRQNNTRLEDRDTNAENRPGADNRPLSRRRIRSYAPQRRAQRQNPRPPQASRAPDEPVIIDEAIHQGMQRLYASYNQCVARLAQADDRFEQFRAAIRQDALELALKVQRVGQDLHNQGQGVERIRHTLFDLVQEKVDHLQEKFQKLGEHLDGITATVDRNEHAKSSSIRQLIVEQEDIRRLVE